MKVLLEDAVVLGYCRPGAAKFFRRHGLDWWTFKEEGLPIEQIERIDDEMARAVVEQARRRQAGEA
ncbi:hypothetical protein CW310_02085 [Pseudomonas citronellolis]|uniref:hypothetical protein n=1 Tax=Pseudomonas citronellolis TaxID=53408 RepID=UPI000942B37E|nr:hypothetical protein [Pseudomonas citronellolis]TGC32435.1 hypothetical protein CW310_02085 [Pseudomonas citronellolis]